LGTLKLVEQQALEDVPELLAAFETILLNDGSGVTSNPVRFDASEPERLRAVALRLLEFEDKHVDPITVKSKVEAFRPGWSLIRDKYTHPSLEPHELLERQGQLEPWLKVLFFDAVGGEPSVTRLYAAVSCWRGRVESGCGVGG
jgi:hypothetical protein